MIHHHHYHHHHHRQDDACASRPNVFALRQWLLGGFSFGWHFRDVGATSLWHQAMCGSQRLLLPPDIVRA
eukprot:2205614-Amphidinium_carterae.1